MFYPNVPDAIPLLTTTGCSFCAVFLTSFFAWSLWNAAREGIRHLRRLHQIPCDRWSFKQQFTLSVQLSDRPLAKHWQSPLSQD